MIILGIVAIAIGVAVGVLGYVAPGQMQIAGLTAEVAAILLMGGILALGLGGLIGAVHDQRRVFRDLAETLVARTDRTSERFTRPTPPPPVPPPPVESSAAAPKQLPTVKPDMTVKPDILPATEPEPVEKPKTPIFAGTVRSLDQARERAGLKPLDTGIAAEPPATEAKISTRETIIAIEKAKADLEGALGATPPPEPPAIDTPAPPPPPPPPEAPEALVVAVSETEVEVAANESDEEQLYVMEEKMIRGRPARVLSDGTVEAETDEGWMRFENLDHLEEYLDAMSPAKG